MDEILARAIFIPTNEIDGIRKGMNPEPFLLKHGNERNDMYVVAVALKSKAEYVLTHDKALSEIIQTHYSESGIEAMTPQKFVATRWKEYW